MLDFLQNWRVMYPTSVALCPQQVSNGDYVSPI